MQDTDQLLVEAASRYQTLLEQGTVISIQDFVATADPALRDELASYLELVLAIGDLEPAVTLTPDEEALTERAALRMRQRWQDRMAVTTTPVLTLTQLRSSRKLTLGAFARALNLPADLLHRVERGGVSAATIPGKLIVRIASVLERTESEIRSALSRPPLTPTGVKLNAEDNTTVGAEVAVSFADALAQSTATVAQRAEWSDLA